MADYMRNSRRREEGDGFFCRFTFGQFFALLILEVFTLFFVFYLGARYGQEFLGLKSDVTVVEGMEIEGDEGEAGVMTTSDPEVRRMAGELIAKAKTPELKERIRSMIHDARGEKPERMPEVVGRNREAEAPPVVPKDPGTRAASRADDGFEPQVVGERAPVQETPPPARTAQQDAGVVRVKSVENARYSVQVGSYPQMGEATTVVERWKGKGFPAYMMIADIPDRGRWYRVRIGGFETRNDAARYLKELQTRENVEALVVLNEQ